MVNIREISLIDLIPPNLRADPQVAAAAEVLDVELKAVTTAVDETTLLARLDVLPEDVVDSLAWQWHVDFYEPDMSLAKKRALIRQSIAWHKSKGTPGIVQDMVSTVYSNGKVYEWFDYAGEPYHFRVETTGVIGSEAIYEQLTRVINAVKNVRSWLDGVYVKREWKKPQYYSGVLKSGKKLIVFPAAFPSQQAVIHPQMRGAIHKGVTISIGPEV